MDTGIAADTASGIATDAATDVAMDLKQAMRQRHTVRKFTSKPLSPELISQLNDRVRANNERLGLAISLKVGDESALPGALKLFFAKGVRNYFVLAGNDRLCTPSYEEGLAAWVEAVERGGVPATRVRESAARVLCWKRDLGLLAPSPEE